MRKVSLPDKDDEYPSKLSGGQKQKVAIARIGNGSRCCLMNQHPHWIRNGGEVLAVMKQLALENDHSGGNHEMGFARKLLTEYCSWMRCYCRGRNTRLFNDPKKERTRASK